MTHEKRAISPVCKSQGHRNDLQSAGASREWESDLKGLGSNQRPGACFTKTVQARIPHISSQTRVPRIFSVIVS